MNPELPLPQRTPESAPANYGQNGEYGSQLGNLERAPEQSHEREQNMQAVDRAAAAPPPPPVLPIATPQLQVVPMPVVQTQTVAPTLAADDDLIEKEWVDQAKKIIMETREDPYKREQEVSKLQADYLRKRYGREIGIST